MSDPAALIEDLFRRESGHLVSALTRLLGPANLALAEDVVHDAMLRAIHTWPSGLPRDPKAWILQTAKNRAIDLIRRDRRWTASPSDDDDDAFGHTLEAALSPAEDATNQLAMMFSICDDSLSRETHVTLILRLLCGLSPAEIGRAFLVDAATIDRRLHRGRARLQALGRLHDPTDQEARARLPSVLHALYLLFNEGYHGSDPHSPLHPGMCADALRLAELVAASPAVAAAEVDALAALFCFHAARLATRLDQDGVLVPLAEQDRTRWDRALIGRGVVHLASASTGDRMTRWHLEAGVACEHTIAASVEDTNWRRIVELYDALMAVAPSPVIAMNRGVAIAELDGLDAGRDALLAVGEDAKVAEYPFYWGALADIERRAGRVADARGYYERAIALTRSRAERVSYDKRLQLLTK
ncbi:MAG TPA: sigma-70 family RNA polymerase sigma factor [Kofleriaceae bacterium]|jgi:RNA polymerase sigma-70 factor (ECF subfamily)|nr:sigma-70 family RNA polymerase sigma factor [Kofleriaceae bacterium]